MMSIEENAGIPVEGLELAIFTGAPGKVEGEFAQWRKDHPRAVVMKVDTGSPIMKSTKLKGIHLSMSPPTHDSVLIAISVLYREVTESQSPVIQEEENVPFQDAKQVAVERFEREYLLRLFERSNYNLGEAARLSGVDRRYLRELFKKHKLEPAVLRAKHRP